MTDDDKPAKKASYPPLAKLAMAITMEKAAKRNQDPSLAERAEELRAQAYQELSEEAQAKSPTLH
jgi:hypothetical protein